MIISFNRILREKLTVRRMIEIYCKLNHLSNGSICSECSRLYDYAMARLDNCPFEDEKPPCNNCLVHCYKKDMRQKVKEVMRFSGPKILTHHPWLAIMHFVDSRYEAKKLIIKRD